jgi:hypothetical protein
LGEKIGPKNKTGAPRRNIFMCYKKLYIECFPRRSFL